jgi:CheY-like chemotaxis protein
MNRRDFAQLFRAHLFRSILGSFENSPHVFKQKFIEGNWLMPTVLVVDDLAVERLLVGGLVNKIDEFTVIYATDGKEALEQLELYAPDLVLTDLRMPGMNGLELVQAMRNDYPLIPVILMTAVGSEDIAVRALESGAASYVPKKYLASILRETVIRVLAASAENRSQTRLMHCMTETSFVLENDLELLSSLVSHLRQVIQQQHVCNESDAIRVATGLDEALLNAYYHGNLEVDSELKAENHNRFHELAEKHRQERPYCDRQIRVTARFSPADATFVIRDEGLGFNPDDLPDPTDPVFLERPFGRGLLLMRSFMDEVSFNDVGNEVTLVKRKSPLSSVDEEVSA